MSVVRVTPGPGQESVWDYPRPPRCEPTTRRVRVVFNGETIADSTNAYRVLETSHPPVYYIPPADVHMELLAPLSVTTHCEFKGSARYYALTVGDRTVSPAAWYYPQPGPAFAPIRDAIAFYPGKMDTCFVDDEPVRAQAGDFYGGWITDAIVGPFKGEPGTGGW